MITSLYDFSKIVKKLSWSQKIAKLHIDRMCEVFSPENINNISYIYFLLDTQDENDVVYIGQTKNLKTRINYHYNEGSKKFDSFIFIPTKDPDELEALEIVFYKPKYNFGLPSNSIFMNLYEIYGFCKENNYHKDIKPLLNKIRSITIGSTKYWNITDLFDWSSQQFGDFTRDDL